MITGVRKRTVVIGAVILAVGVVMVVAGGVGALSSLTINTSFTQPHPGEYVSSEIALNATSELVVSSPAATGGIIRAQNLNLVNSTNIDTYAIAYSASGAGSDVYKSLSGDYYYVAFASTQPNAKIVALTQGSSVLAYGGLVLLGVVLLIAGIAITVVGLLRKGPPAVAGQL